MTRKEATRSVELVVLQALDNAGGVASSREIRELTPYASQTVSVALKRLEAKGEVQRVRRGLWRML